MAYNPDPLKGKTDEQKLALAKGVAANVDEYILCKVLDLEMTKPRSDAVSYVTCTSNNTLNVRTGGELYYAELRIDDGAMVIEGVARDAKKAMANLATEIALRVDQYDEYQRSK